MQSFQWIKGDVVNFHFNSDLSGNVQVYVNGKCGCEIPGEALLAFVAEHVRRERCGYIEQMSDERILGIEKGE